MRLRIVYSRGRESPARGRGRRSAAVALEQAAGTFSGEFLPEDIYEDWATSIRSPLRERHLEVLCQLARVYQAKGNRAAALQTCRRYLAAEPAAERAVRLAMDLLYQTGKKQAALSMYNELTATLAREYNAGPESQSAALCEKIRRGHKQPIGKRRAAPNRSIAGAFWPVWPFSRPPDVTCLSH